MKYQLAKEKYKHVTVAVVVSSNCTDKEEGHAYEWLLYDKKEIAEIRKQHPSLTCAILRCRKCGKVTHSM